ncbi:MAG: carbohydrate ABC transporter permease [Saccharofermentanales bacterium]
MVLSRKRKQLNRSPIGNIFVYIVLMLVGAFLALPLIYALASAVKPYEEIFLFPPKFYAINPTLTNFRDLFNLCMNSLVPFSRYLFNSIMISVVVTVFHVLLASMAAYPLAKNEFVGKNVLFSIIIASLLFVPQVTFLPQYILMSKMHILNSYLAVIVPNLGTAMGLFLMKQFMEQIPISIIEAPRIDGASEMRILFRIIIPNVKPAWLTLSIFTFQGIWNAGGQNVLFDEQIKLLPTMLSQITSENAIARMGVGMAATVFLMIPPIIFFIVSQSKIITTMAFAGIKE